MEINNGHGPYRGPNASSEVTAYTKPEEALESKRKDLLKTNRILNSFAQAINTNPFDNPIETIMGSFKKSQKPHMVFASPLIINTNDQNALFGTQFELIKQALESGIKRIEIDTDHSLLGENFRSQFNQLKELADKFGVSIATIDNTESPFKDDSVSTLYLASYNSRTANNSVFREKTNAFLVYSELIELKEGGALMNNLVNDSEMVAEDFFVIAALLRLGITTSTQILRTLFKTDDETSICCAIPKINIAEIKGLTKFPPKCEDFTKRDATLVTYCIEEDNGDGGGATSRGNSPTGDAPACRPSPQSPLEIRGRMQTQTAA